MERILITEELTEESLRVAREHDCKELCALNGELKLVEHARDIHAVNNPELDIEAQWKGWDLATETVNALASTYPELFEVDGFNMQNTIIKDIWWGLFKEKGRLVKNCEFHLNQGKEVFVYTSHQLPTDLRSKVSLIPKAEKQVRNFTAKIVGVGLGYAVGYDIRNSKPKVNAETKDHNKEKTKVVFFPTSIKQVEFFENVFSQLGPKNVLGCFGIEELSDPLEDITTALDIKEIPYTKVTYNRSTDRLKKFLKLTWNILKEASKISEMLGNRESYIIYQSLLNSLYKCYLYEEVNKKLNPHAFLVNAFENTYSGDLLVQVAHNHDARVVNTMNGLKIATPQNQDTQFDTWAMWSEAQKKDLVENAYVNENQIQITGHLMADNAIKHRYQGTMDRILKEWPNKQILAIFSQPQEFPGDYRKNFINTVTDYIEKRSNLIGILKPHPRESYEELKTLTKDNKRLILLKHDEQHPTVQLYDLLTIADLSTVIYSTVAYESLFFETPVVSLNYTGIPELLPMANYDNNWLTEVTGRQEFFEALDRCFNKLKDKSLSKNKRLEITGPVDGRVANRVAKILLNGR